MNDNLDSSEVAGKASSLVDLLVGFDIVSEDIENKIDSDELTFNFNFISLSTFSSFLWKAEWNHKQQRFILNPINMLHKAQQQNYLGFSGTKMFSY